jgi:SrtB family sortase
MEYIKKYRFIVFAVLIISAVAIIIVNINEKRKTKDILIQRKPVIEQEVPTANNLPTIDFDALRKKYHNNDIKGAIRISDEKFEEIVFQTDDNKYYLTHNYRGKKTNGEIFIDYKQNIDKSELKIVYGDGKKETSILKKYNNYEYYNKHKYIELETDKAIYKYEVLTVYEGNIDFDKLDMEDTISNSKYKYNLNYTKEDEYLIFRTKVDNTIINIISKKVN